jgi:hypothetical protein
MYVEIKPNMDTNGMSNIDYPVVLFCSKKFLGRKYLGFFLKKVPKVGFGDFYNDLPKAIR